MTSEIITSSDLIDLVLDSSTTVMEIADIPSATIPNQRDSDIDINNPMIVAMLFWNQYTSSGASCIIMVHGGEWVRAEWYGDVEGDCWAIQRWPLYPKCEGPVQKDVVIRWLEG